MTPKFRAWIDGGMIYPQGDLYIAFYSDPTCVEWSIVSRYDGTVMYDHDLTISDSDNNHLMLFTGLFDRHGKEIFTKDILQGLFPNGDEYYGVVEFEKGCFIVKETGFNYEGSNDEPMSLYEWLKEDTCRCVGNVFENPELIK